MANIRKTTETELSEAVSSIDSDSHSLRTIAEMKVCIKQYHDGLLTLYELLLAVQLSPNQVNTCIAMTNLPYAAMSKINVNDLG